MVRLHATITGIGLPPTMLRDIGNGTKSDIPPIPSEFSLRSKLPTSPLVYSKSHFKSVTFALHVFRSLLKQFPSDCHEMTIGWKLLVSSLTAPALPIAKKNIIYFKS